MQRLIFESSPAFIIVCLALGLGYAWLLYRTKHTWGQGVNRILFVIRALAVALAAFLLIGPILKLTTNQFEKPAVVFLVDNSQSVSEVLGQEKKDALVANLTTQSKALEDNGYQVQVRGLDGPNVSTQTQTSDIHGALRSITADYEGKNLARIVLVSDGVYNSGPSPLYTTLRIPVYTVGVGDTTQRTDLALKNIAFNKIAYQGNRFPVRTEVLVKGLTNQDVRVSVSMGGKVIASQNKNSGTKGLIDFDFVIDANEKGIQRLDVAIDPLKQETNQKNNRTAIYVEVVEGKKKILVVAPAPHPDIKAIRAAIEKNSNYEFHLHMPGVKEEVNQDILQVGKADLIIFSQVLDNEGKTLPLVQKLLKSRAGMLFMVGAKTNLRQFANIGVPLVFENIGQKDEVIPNFNTQFRDFAFSDNLAGRFSRYPPITVPFGKFTYPADAAVLLYQRIGSVATNRPLLLSWNGPDNRIAVLLGEGIWKWRLNEFAETEKSEAFDEVFSKLIQYLSTADDKRRFRAFPVQNEFTDSEPVTFESQLYNDLFEPIYGNTVQIELRDETGKATQYTYVTSQSGSRYRIGGLKEGIYRYTASTQLSTGKEQVSGEFLMTAQNIESQNLTADFSLLRKLAAESGGKFYTEGNSGNLNNDLTTLQAKTLIHSEDSFHPMINLKAVFFLLLFLLSLEWFTRKFFGSY
ncbi:MAG TPA: hypothetical protein VK508_12105 [Cyclobacteriaceae bacterium]|nr:hypothetical protein [Cyclobacteriaceae bacterium]